MLSCVGEKNVEGKLQVWCHKRAGSSARVLVRAAFLWFCLHQFVIDFKHLNRNDQNHPTDFFLIFVEKEMQ